ncbi:hypothetical protein [Lysinibacter sp. HNR]|uniref:hypothetical protein n=1 Tax=Lysinibacter sp. HNR TaxID=3031408 RepID=UPI0024359E55|nr:hypothetical protein [Lysinibacter sp. HNR]WGD36844.1 hypothetical protein FrondiHNR_10340 [Lysinibacter sp. HNR]
MATLAVAISLTLMGCATVTAIDTADSPTSTPRTAPSTQAPAGSQSVAEACDAVNQEFEAVSAGMLEMLSTLAEDPESAMTLLDDFNNTLTTIADGVENEEVKTELSTFALSFGTLMSLSQQMEEDIASIDIEALTTANYNLETASANLEELCGF